MSRLWVLRHISTKKAISRRKRYKRIRPICIKSYGAESLARRKSRVRLPPGSYVGTIFPNRPGNTHPLSSELENSGIRVAVGDCSVTERRRWRPPYQTGKTVHVHANLNTTNTTRTDAWRRVPGAMVPYR